MRELSATIGVAVGFFFGSTMSTTMMLFFKDVHTMWFWIVSAVCLFVAMNVAYAIEKMVDRKEQRAGDKLAEESNQETYGRNAEEFFRMKNGEA